MKSAILEMASLPGFNISKSVIKIVVDIMMNQNKENIPNIVSSMSLEFFNYILQTLRGNKKTEEMPLSELELCKQIFPQIILALREIQQENYESFLDEFARLNNTIFDAFSKRILHQNSLFASEDKEKGDTKEVTRAFPPVILDFFEVIKILISSTKLITVSYERIIPAIFSILNTITGKNYPEMIDFLALLLSESKRNVKDSKMNPMDREQQYKILRTVAIKLGIAPPILQIFWKIWKEDPFFNKQLISDIAAMCKLEKHVVVVELLLNIILLFSSKGLTKEIAEVLTKFDFTPQSAKFVDLVGRGFQALSIDYESFCHTPIRDALSIKLKIPDKEIFGIISLLRGNIQSPYAEQIICSICTRFNIQQDLVHYVGVILTILTSRDPEILAQAMKELNFPWITWLYMGRRVLHPKDIPNSVFEKYSLMSESNVRSRSALGINDLNVWKNWAESVRRAIQKNIDLVMKQLDKISAYNINRHKGEKPELISILLGEKKKLSQNEDIISIIDKLISSIGDICDLGAEKENMLKAKLSNLGLHIREGMSLENLVLHDLPEDKIKYNTSKIAKALCDLFIYINEMVGFLLMIEHEPLNSAFIEKILSGVPAIAKKSNSSRGDFEIICRFLSVRDIINKKDKTLNTIAANNIASFLECDPSTILSLADFLMGTSESDMRMSIREFSNILGSRSPHFLEFGNFAVDKIFNEQLAENAIKFLGNTFHFPPLMVRLFLSTTTEGEYKAEIGELMTTFELLTSHLPIKEIYFTMNQDEDVTERNFNLIPFDEIKYLICSLAAGHTEPVNHFLRWLKIKRKAKALIKVLTLKNTQKMLTEALDTLWPLFKKFGRLIDKKGYKLIMSCFIFLKGFAKEIKIKEDELPEEEKIMIKKEMKTEKPKISILTYLSRCLGVIPEVLECIIDVMKCECDLLTESIKKLVQAINDMRGENIIDPNLIVGIISIARGKFDQLDQLASKIGIRQEIVELCVSLATFGKCTGSDSKLEKKLMEIRMNPGILQAWKFLGMRADIMEEIFRLSYNRVKLEDMIDILEKLGIKQYYVDDFLLGILAIMRGRYTFPILGEEGVAENSPICKDIMIHLEKHLKPICDHKLYIDYDIAIMAIRIMQGDFFVLDDKKMYLMPFLPNSKVLDCCMGMCGMISLPVDFSNEIGHFPEMPGNKIRFDTACTILCNTLNINPILCQLVCLDGKAIQKIAEITEIKPQVLGWVFATLSKVPIRIAQILIFKEFLRKIVYQRKLFNDFCKDIPKFNEDKIFEYKNSLFQREHNTYFDSNDYYKLCKRQMQSFDKKSTIFEENPGDISEVFEYLVFDTLEESRSERKEIFEQAFKKISSFPLSEAEFKEIFGTEAEFQRVVSDKLITKQNIEEGKEMAEKPDYYPKNCIPPWELIKKTIKEISQTIELVGNKKPKYMRISLNHIYILVLIVNLKRKLQDKKVKYNESKLTIFHAEIMLLMQCLEVLEMETNVFKHKFEKSRFMKILSLALGVGISNLAIHGFQKSPKKLNEILANPLYLDLDEAFKLASHLRRNSMKDEYISKFLKVSALDLIPEKLHKLTIEDALSSLITPNEYEDAALMLDNLYYTSFSNRKINDVIKFDDFKIESEDQFYQDYGETLEFKSHLLAIPAEAIDDKPDKLTQFPAEKIKTMYKSFEIALIVDFKKLDFIIELARGNLSVIEEFHEGLSRCGFLPKGDSIRAYQGICKLLTLSKDIIAWKAKQQDINDIVETQYDLSSLKALLSLISLSARIDYQFAECILLLCHGLLHKNNFAQLSSKCNTSHNLLRTLFLSSYFELLQNPKLQKKWMIEPLINQFSAEQKPIIESVLNIYSGNIHGWHVLLKNDLISRKRDERARSKFSQFLNLIDWDKLSSEIGKAKTINNIYKFTKTHIITELYILLTVVFQLNDRFHNSNNSIQELLEIISALLKQDIENILVHLERLFKNMKINPASFKHIEALLVFINSSMVKLTKKDYQQKKILAAAEELANWLSDKVKSLPGETKGNQSLLSLGIQGVILAAYNKNGAFGKLVNRFKSFANNIVQRLNKIRQYKKYIVEEERDIDSLKAACFKPLILAVSNLYDYATIAYEHFIDDFFTSLRNATKGEGGIIPLANYIEATKSVSLEKIVVKEGIFSEEWDSTKVILVNENKKSESEHNENLQEVIHSCSTAPGLELFIYLLLNCDEHLLDLIPKEHVKTVQVITSWAQIKASIFQEIIENDTILGQYLKDVHNLLMSRLLPCSLEEKKEEKKESINSLEAVNSTTSRSNLLIEQFVVLLQALRFKCYSKKKIIEVVLELFIKMSTQMPKLLEEHYIAISKAIIGYNFLKNDADHQIKTEEKIKIILKSLVNVYTPEFKKCADLIEKFVAFALKLYNIVTKKEDIIKNSKIIAESIAETFGANPKDIKELIGIIQGNVISLVDFTAGYCKLNPTAIQGIISLMSETSKSVFYLEKLVMPQTEKKVLDDSVKESYISLMRKVTDGTASSKELFRLVEMEGSGNGGINREEFQSLALKLGMMMSEHRIAEIFSRCKDKNSKKVNELDEKEFEDAIMYIQFKRVGEALNILGLSRGQLIFLFIMLTIILLLMFGFIFVGIAAFSIGGTFGSIINSILPVSAGVAVSKQAPIDLNGKEWLRKLENAVNEVRQIIGGEF